MMDRIEIAGECRLTRRANGEQREGLVTVDVALTADDAAVRISPLASGVSHLCRFHHRVSRWTLGEIDAAIAAAMHADRPVLPRFKDPDVTRDTDTTPPPPGYAWCPSCLGCLERAPTCPTCDGNRIVRQQD